MENSIKVHDLYFRKYITHEEIQERVQFLGDQISRKYKGQCPVMIGILNGVYVFMADLSRACDIDVEISFIKLSSYRGTSSTGNVDTVLGLNTPLQDKPVIIVEDIVDSGKTLDFLVPKLREHNPASIEIVSLLVKREAIEYPVTVNYVGFEIPTKFVVGYGLDYNGKGRNLRSIYQLVN